MQQLITQTEYDECLLGYHITDCAVRTSEYFHFIARHTEQSETASVISEHTVSKLEVGFYLDESLGDRLGTQGLGDFESPLIGASVQPVAQVVCVAASGKVYSRGSDIEEFESEIPWDHKKGPSRGSIHRIRMIHGRLYVVGSGHTVCRRRGVNDWESLCFDLPVMTRADFDDVNRSDNMAFVDIDGFNHEDLYAIAGKGRIWHCDGKQWKQVPFPSNMFLHSICCAGDGEVYIGAQSGTVFRGRGQRWEMISRGDMSLPFKDMVWHADRVWCTSDYGLWQIDGKRVVPADVRSEIKVCAGNLSAAEGVLLMAGVHGAAFHDGRDWQVIFNKLDMES